MNLPTAIDQASLSSYVSSVMAMPMLDEQEEHDHGVANQKGNFESAKALIQSHLKYVVKVAKELEGYRLPQADLIQEGNLGLMKAVKNYKPTEGKRLVSFAHTWIRGQMMDYIMSNVKLVKLGGGKVNRKLFYNLRKLKADKSPLKQDEATLIADKLCVPVEDVLRMDSKLTHNEIVFDQSAEDDYSPESYLTDLSGTPEQVLSNAQEDEGNRSKLIRAVATLPEREGAIFQQRHLNDVKVSLKEIAQELGVSIERVRQIEAKAMKRVKDFCLH